MLPPRTNAAANTANANTTNNVIANTFAWNTAANISNDAHAGTANTTSAIVSTPRIVLLLKLAAPLLLVPFVVF